LLQSTNTIDKRISAVDDEDIAYACYLTKIIIISY